MISGDVKCNGESVDITFFKYHDLYIFIFTFFVYSNFI